MNREDIISMALEVDMAPPEGFFIYWNSSEKQLERFAALVAAAEREACAKVCEAEADATDAHLHLCIDALRDCADAIRARGQA